MSLTMIALCALIGLTAGCLSGMFGIGGGVIMVPAFVLIVGMSQHQAQGTTLALMVPPIGLLAAYTYYQKGHVDLKVAGVVCVAFFIGGLIGANFANAISETILKKAFAVLMLLIAVKMFFS